MGLEEFCVTVRLILWEPGTKGEPTRSVILARWAEEFYRRVQRELLIHADFGGLNRIHGIAEYPSYFAVALLCLRFNGFLVLDSMLLFLSGTFVGENQLLIHTDLRGLHGSDDRGNVCYFAVIFLCVLCDLGG